MTVRMAQRSNWKAHSSKTSCMLMGTAAAPIFAKAKVADTYSGELYSWMATLSPFFTPADRRKFAVRFTKRSNSP